MSYSQTIIDQTREKYSHQTEFIQSVEEVLSSIHTFLESNPKYQEYKILERIVEPDRIYEFRITWLDDNNTIQVNKGFRVEFNNAIGPYKGGLRFHPSVNQSILKFLGFEQIFKNSLTGLPLGGGKGGSDFNPKGRSDMEIMRFSQAFMSELFKYIGIRIDVPAGDIGVGSKEIGYLFGQYKRLTNTFEGVLTGKSIVSGGSLIRTEATGYGLVYFATEVLKQRNSSIQNKRVLISGSGNVAQYAAEKVVELGGKVISMSDSSGSIFIKDGLTTEQLNQIKEIKNIKRGRIKEIADSYNEIEYLENKRPWAIDADIVLPCATQNEIDVDDIKMFSQNNVILLAEGSNMSTTNTGIDELKSTNIIYVPGKASNAGGVAVSGLEMSQNSLGLQWEKNEVDQKLKEIMKSIHDKCIQYGATNKTVDYVRGANIAGFKKVADAIIYQGAI